jgi:hypothetical protein
VTRSAGTGGEPARLAPGSQRRDPELRRKNVRLALVLAFVAASFFFAALYLFSGTP